MTTIVKVALLGVVLSVALVSSASAWEWKGPLRRSGPKHYPPAENRYAHVPPGHERFYAEQVPAYPWLSQGLAVPTYNWGYFGARYQPRCVQHEGYYDDHDQLSFRPGE